MIVNSLFMVQCDGKIFIVIDIIVCGGDDDDDDVGVGFGGAHLHSQSSTRSKDVTTVT